MRAPLAIATLPARVARSEAAAAALAGGMVGAAGAVDPLVGAAAVGLLLAAVGLTAPTAAWVLAAVTLALLGRGLGVLGAPEALAQLAVVPAWIAFGLGLFRSQNRRLAGLISALIGAFIAITLLSGALSGSEPLRPVFYLSLLITPFALIGAIVLDPPDQRWRRMLTGLLIAVLVLQIPFALWQFRQFGIGDSVQGTFAGSEVGAHMTASVSILGAIWLVLRGKYDLRWLALLGMLAIVPLLAAANQVILAAPLALVLMAAISNRRLAIAGVVSITIAALLLLLPGWNSDYARSSLSRAAFALKMDAVTAVADDAADSGRVLILGQGPAKTVSHASFLTSEEDPLLGSLGLEPAEMPDSFGLREVDEAVSIKRPESSIVGLLGDVGVIGLLCYLSLLAVLFDQCRRRTSPTAQAAAVGLVMLAILGYISDWLEQPGLAIFVATLAGLALSVAPPARTGRREPTR